MMRIIGRKEFLDIEGQVLYSKVYGKYKLGELFIKLGNCGRNDWVKQSVAADAVECGDSGEYEARIADAWKGIDVPMDFDSGIRDSCYEGDDVLFAVFSESDVGKLINALQHLTTKEG